MVGNVTAWATPRYEVCVAVDTSRMESGQLVSPGQTVRRWRLWLLAERTAWVFGVVCLVAWGVLKIAGVSGARHELARFTELQAASRKPTATPDMSLWSPGRVSAWRTAMNDPAPPPLAVLRIPKIGLEVAVLPGTDDATLNRAVGHIEGTALPATDGNSAIAGHRDGFFRGLKDIADGDAIELETVQRKDVYRVERVLDRSDRKTCRYSTQHPHARSRWSHAIRSTSSARRRSGTSSGLSLHAPESGPSVCARSRGGRQCALTARRVVRHAGLGDGIERRRYVTWGDSGAARHALVCLMAVVTSAQTAP